MDKLFILHSGFVTDDPTHLNKIEKKKNLTLRDKIYVSDSRVVDTENYYDEEVENLYRAFSNDNSLITRFDFRQQVLEAAIRTLKVKKDSIVPWIEFQLNQRTVGYLHRKFLKEMIESISFGTPKTMENANYYRLLSANYENNGLQTRPEHLDEILRKYVDNNEDTLLSSLLTRWTTTIHGTVDLLTTLRVIFGART